MFLYYVSNVLQGILLIHVDNFINNGNKTFDYKVTNALRQSFCIGKHADTSFNVLN